MIEPRHPRAEADALLVPGFEARVLEPSPPASTDPRWMADDPTDVGESDGVVVSPAGDGGLRWDEYLSDHPEASGFARRRWLGDLAPLAPLPDTWEVTRRSLHLLAFYVIAPRRYDATGKMGLRFTAGGFGTPFFGEDEQVRVEEGRLVVQRAGSVRHSEPTTLADAADFVGVPFRQVWYQGFHDPPESADGDRPVPVDPTAASVLGDWFGFSTHVLERLRRSPGAARVGRVQLWPEHFDPAVEIGEEGRRASFGGSPGDAAHPEPYLYVSAWQEIDRDRSFWNDAAFNGASLSYRSLIEAHDPVETGLGFLRQGLDILSS